MIFSKEITNSRTSSLDSSSGFSLFWLLPRLCDICDCAISASSTCAFVLPDSRSLLEFGVNQRVNFFFILAQADEQVVRQLVHQRVLWITFLLYFLEVIQNPSLESKVQSPSRWVRTMDLSHGQDSVCSKTGSTSCSRKRDAYARVLLQIFAQVRICSSASLRAELNPCPTPCVAHRRVLLLLLLVVVSRTATSAKVCTRMASDTCHEAVYIHECISAVSLLLSDDTVKRAKRTILRSSFLMRPRTRYRAEDGAMLKR